MATDKKHIAVYLAPEIEQALVAFCERKGLISKKGTMYSAGVNTALAQFFEITDTDTDVTVTEKGNTPSTTGNTPSKSSNIPLESIAVEVLPGKLESGDSWELPKVDNQVVEQLQNELSSLKAENETLKGDYAKLLESSTHASELPEAGDLLNKLKAKRKKTGTTLADVEALLKLIDENC